MASIDTAERTAQLAKSTTRNVNFSYRAFQKPLRIADPVTITLTADSDGANDDIVIGNLGCAGTIRPEHCRLVGLSGSVQGTFTLEKVSTDGTVAALTGLATLATDGVSVPFLRKSGPITGAAFDASDYLQLTIGTATALEAGDEIELQIAYTTEDIQ